MSHDDSDSSDGDSSVYTTTNALLGYASREPTNDGFSQLGGTPKWPDTTSPPSSTLARCKNCNCIMTLLLQLLADLPENFPSHERRLYIFSCKKKACRRKDGTMRVIRGTKAAAKTQREKDETSGNGQDAMDEIRKKEKLDKLAEVPLNQMPMLGDMIFTSTFKTADETRSNPFAKPQSQASPRPLNDHFHHPFANPFASPPTPTPLKNHINSDLASQSASTFNQNPSPIATSSKDLATTFAEKARISTPSNQQTKPLQPPPYVPWPPLTELPEPYPAYYLDADVETLYPTPPPSLSKPTTAMDIDTSTSEPLDKDAFESHLDNTFQKFADRVAQNPEQVLRYEYGGQPVLYSSTDIVGRIFASHNDSQGENLSGVKLVRREGGRVPNCENCGVGREFECQLMPAAITALEVAEEGLDGMEWGSVIVEVCERDCTLNGQEEEWVWKEEWCGVQWEEVK